jgi:hypothetical protein
MCEQLVEVSMILRTAVLHNAPEPCNKVELAVGTYMTLVQK